MRWASPASISVKRARSCGVSIGAAPLSSQGLATGVSCSPNSRTAPAGTPLSFSVEVKAANAVRYSLGGAPYGMSISSTGVVGWSKPVAGSYSVTVKAKDSTTGLSGQGVYAIRIEAPPALAVSSGSITAPAGKPLSFTVTTGSTNPVSYTLVANTENLTLSGACLLRIAVPL